MTATRSPHLRWPLLLLLGSIGVTVAAGWQAVSASRQHMRTARQLLHDYAAFAAWSYQGSVNAALGEAAWMVLEPVMHEHLHQWDRWPDAGSLPGYFADNLIECRCDPGSRPGYYFGFVLGTDTVRTVAGTMPAPQGQWIRTWLEALLRSSDRVSNRLALQTRRHDGQPFLLAYALMPTVRFDTVVYGFVFDPASLPAALEQAAAARPLLPTPVSRGRPNGEIIATRVRTVDGALLYQAADWPEWEYAVTEQLSPQFAGLQVQASLRPALSGPVLAGGVPPSRLAILAGLVLLSAALTVIAVRQLRREAEIARLRSDFVASVSHELRTPLAQIRLFLETVRLRRYQTDEQREWLLSHLDRETTRLGNLVENVLRFARLDRAPSGALEEADLATVVGEAVRAYEPLATSRRARLAADLQPGLLAPVDRAGLAQAVTNLLDNAVKYGPPHQEVEVRLAARGGEAVLTVTDQGPGIPAEARDRIWDPFYRGPGDASRAVGGSGLGLAIVRAVVERLGGRVRVEDAAPGTRVTLTLPLAAGAAGPGAPPRPLSTGAAS